MDPARALRSHALFSGLDEATLRALEAEVRIVALEGGRLLFAQGDPADGLYGVLEGRLRVGGDGVAPGEVGAGGYVGERAALTGAPHPATARAARDTTLLHVSAAGFRRLARDPAFGLALARDLARGAGPAPGGADAGARTVAVVPLGPAAGCDRFVDDLTAAFARQGTAIALRAAEAPPAALADGGLPGYLRRAERDHDVVVLVGAPDAPDWTRCCLRHADLVLVVAAPDGPSQPPPDGLADGGAPVELVLLRAAAGPPGGTAAWLGRGPYRRHHHAAAGRPDDAARVARLLRGRATGLALSGGGSRATAYVGVFKALAACGVPIDVVAGTSGGAMLGAMYAQGWGPDAMLEGVRVLERTPFYRDVGPPFVSVLGGRAINRVLRGYFGASRLEDTPVRLLPVCASLPHSRIVVPTEGPLWRAVRASCAAPGIFPPVPWEGDLLVDGGIVNNLPADLLEPSCAHGRVIAADVHAAPSFAAAPADLDELGGWRVLWRRWTAAARAPSLLDIVQQAAGLAGNAHRERTLPRVHVHVRPFAHDPAGKTGLAAMVEAGYRETMIALEAASG